MTSGEFIDTKLYGIHYTDEEGVDRCMMTVIGRGNAETSVRTFQNAHDTWYAEFAQPGQHKLKFTFELAKD